MKSRTLEQITVRRAKLADTDKVRYRVYSTAVEFIAVIAESALMAVKVSGISKPYKIVRDLPTDGVAVEAKRMSQAEAVPEQVNLAMKQSEAPKKIVAELNAIDPKAKQTAFKPMNLGDLQNKRTSSLRIIPPEMLSAIIQEHAKAAAPAAPTPTVVEAVAAAVVPVDPAPPPPAPLEPALPDEHLLQQVKEALSGPSPEKIANRDLSPDEVKQLLNE